MSKFDTLFNSLREAVTPTTGTTPAAQPNTTTATTPATSTATPTPATTPVQNNQKIDANHPVVKELAAAKDANQVISALQKLGVK